MIPLLPCPFCENEAEIEQVGDRRQSTIYRCTSCGCSLETGEEWDHGRQWNSRADAPDAPVMSGPEQEVLHFLVKAWDTFVSLPIEHPDQLSEFRHALHDLQRQIMVRPVRRAAGLKVAPPSENPTAEDLLLRLCTAMAKRDEGGDGNWGHPSLESEVKAVKAILEALRR